MKKKLLLTIFRLGFASLIFAAIITQLTHGWKYNHLNTVNFFSYFTIQSNIIAASIFIASIFSLLSKKENSTTLNYLRGAATFYMLVTGIVYALLLSDQNVQTTLPWVNTVLHRIFPIVLLLDWFIDPPKKAIKSTMALLWLIYPLAYCAYSLIRGAETDWYPYPFINVSAYGYAKVAINSVIIAVGAAFLSLVVAYLPSKIQHTLKKSPN